MRNILGILGYLFIKLAIKHLRLNIEGNMKIKKLSSFVSEETVFLNNQGLTKPV